MAFQPAGDSELDSPRAEHDGPGRFRGLPSHVLFEQSKAVGLPRQRQIHRRIAAYAAALTQLILDISGYFAPEPAR